MQSVVQSSVSELANNLVFIALALLVARLTTGGFVTTPEFSDCPSRKASNALKRQTLLIYSSVVRNWRVVRKLSGRVYLRLFRLHGVSKSERKEIEERSNDKLSQRNEGRPAKGHHEPT